MRVGAKKRNVRSVGGVGYGGHRDIESGFVDNILDDGFEDREQYDEEQGDSEAGPNDGGDDEPATLVERWFGWSSSRRGVGLWGQFRFSGSCRSEVSYGNTSIVGWVNKRVGVLVGSTGRGGSIS